MLAEVPRTYARGLGAQVVGLNMVLEERTEVHGSTSLDLAQDGKACLLASWFLSRETCGRALPRVDRRGINPGTSVLQASSRRKTRPGAGRPWRHATTADATVWQKPKPSCSPAGARPRGGLYVVCIQNQTPEGVRFRRIKQARSTDHISVYNKLDRALGLQLGFAAPTARPARCR